MEWPRLPFRLRSPRFPRLLAAAVIVECCVRLCPAPGTATGSTPGTATGSTPGTATGSTPGTADPCALLGTATGQRCRTDPEPGAAAGRALTPEAAGQLRAATELPPSPGTPPRTAGSPSPSGSPGGPRAVRERTGSTVLDGTERPGTPRSAGIAEQAAAGSERPPPAPAPREPDTAPAAGPAPRASPGGNGKAEGSTAPQGTPSHSPSSTVPGSAGGQRVSPSALPGQTPAGTGLVQREEGSDGPSSPEPWAPERQGVTVPLGDSSPGTHPRTTPATDSSTMGTVGTSPFGGALQSVLSPVGTWQGLAGGQGSDPHLRSGTDVAWQGPHSAPLSSLLFLGAGGPVPSTAQPALGTAPNLLPTTARGSGLPVPTGGTPGVTSPDPGTALNLTTVRLGLPDTEGPPEHSPVPLDQPWHPPAVSGEPPASVALGVTHDSLGPPRGPPSRLPGPASGSAALTPPTPQPSLGTSRGVPGLSPSVGTPPAGPLTGHQLLHRGVGGDPDERPQIRGGTEVGVGEDRPWAVTAPLSWQPGSPAQPSALAPPQQLPPSQPASSLGPNTAAGVTATSVTTATASPALLGAGGTVPLEPGAAVLQQDAVGLTGRSPTHPPTMVPEPPQQPTDPPGTLGHRGEPEFPPAAGGTDLLQPSGSPGGWPDADTPRVTPAPAAAGRAPRVFIVEDQPPLLRASLLRIPCELVLDTGFVPALRDPASRERRRLLHSFNQTVAPLFTSVPGFLRLEVTGIREGLVLEYDALFAAERVPVPVLDALLDAALGSGGSRPGLAVGAAPVLRNVALERPLDPCAALFACQAGFACVPGADGNATCTSLCHRGYCKNQGICTHLPDHGPLCQCPVGSDFWFMGLRCDYRVTRQSLLGMAAGVLLSILLLGAVIAAVAVRRFKVLLLEARADQTRSSYRRFCRLDDVCARSWPRSWPPSASSLDNPAFSASEELLHLRSLDAGCCGCRHDAGTAGGTKERPARPPCRPSFHYEWDMSSSSINDPMVDSGKASDISVSSWPMEPIQWTPFPLLHQLSRQRPHKARRPRSYCEGMELVNLERSWTA